MAASFPGAIKTFSARTDDVDDVMATDVNQVYDEVAAIETALGTDPEASAADVKTRLARSLDGLGNLDFAAIGGLTISSGSITPTQNWHSVDTEGSAASDDLDTIGDANVTDGFVLFLRQNNAGRDVTIKHNTGNIKCPGATNISLTDIDQIVILIYDGANDYWVAAVSSTSTLLASNNTWTGINNFGAAFGTKYTGVSGNTTLDGTHQTVDVDTSGAARTITLPTAIGITGRRYDVRKKTVDANAVTIATTSSQTINGAATKSLAAQYDTATLMSDGANWIVL